MLGLYDPVGPVGAVRSGERYNMEFYGEIQCENHDADPGILERGTPVVGEDYTPCDKPLLVHYWYTHHYGAPSSFEMERPIMSWILWGLPSHAFRHTQHVSITRRKQYIQDSRSLRRNRGHEQEVQRVVSPRAPLPFSQFVPRTVQRKSLGKEV